MELEISLPLFLPHLQEIKTIILSELQEAQKVEKVVFSSPGMDAAGLQLLIALQKEFPYLSLEIAEGGAGERYRKLLLGGEGDV